MTQPDFLSWEQAVAWMVEQPGYGALVKACYYDKPLSHAATRYHSSDEWRAVRRFLPTPPSRALDLGAGHGITSFALACDGWKVLAVEPNPSNTVGSGAIRGLSEQCSLGIDVYELTGERLPFSDRTFDLVLARQALHHSTDLRSLCLEAFRLLRPGGRFIALREHVISRTSDLRLFWQQHPLHRLYGGEHAFLLGTYVDALVGAGLRILRTLGPFESPINYAPHTLRSLHDLLLRRLDHAGLRVLAEPLLATDTRLRLLLWFLSCIDDRPGRLYSFICERPE